MNAPNPVDSIDALALTVPRTPIQRHQDAGGDPSVGSAAIFALGPHEVGVWDMGIGAMYDVEADEVFVVLAGTATVEVLDASGLVASQTELRPGIVCRLRAGTRTRWTVHATLRKLYVLASR
jgi:uncharacterized cupin superfamily protein